MQYPNTTKLLGLTLDQKLTLKQHIKERTSIAKTTQIQNIGNRYTTTTQQNLIPATNTILTNSHCTLKKASLTGSAKDSKQSS